MSSAAEESDDDFREDGKAGEVGEKPKPKLGQRPDLEWDSDIVDLVARHFAEDEGEAAYFDAWIDEKCVAVDLEAVARAEAEDKDVLHELAYTELHQEFTAMYEARLEAFIHSKGWTREQAIDFMLDNSGMTRTEVVAEVERYIAIPSQALAYKIGALKIQELRERAQAKLGDAFDIKDFHAQVLNTGGLPLPVLEEKIDRWIANGGG